MKYFLRSIFPSMVEKSHRENERKNKNSSSITVSQCFVYVYALFLPLFQLIINNQKNIKKSKTPV